MIEKFWQGLFIVFGIVFFLIGVYLILDVLSFIATQDSDTGKGRIPGDQTGENLAGLIGGVICIAFGIGAICISLVPILDKKLRDTDKPSDVPEAAQPLAQDETQQSPETKAEEDQP
jgi:hypothetical protein